MRHDKATINYGRPKERLEGFCIGPVQDGCLRKGKFHLYFFPAKEACVCCILNLKSNPSIDLKSHLPLMIPIHMLFSVPILPPSDAFTLVLDLNRTRWYDTYERSILQACSGSKLISRKRIQPFYPIYISDTHIQKLCLFGCGRSKILWTQYLLTETHWTCIYLNSKI